MKKIAMLLILIAGMLLALFPEFAIKYIIIMDI